MKQHARCRARMAMAKLDASSERVTKPDRWGVSGEGRLVICSETRKHENVSWLFDYRRRCRIIPREFPSVLFPDVFWCCSAIASAIFNLHASAAIILCHWRT